MFFPIGISIEIDNIRLYHYQSNQVKSLSVLKISSFGITVLKYYSSAYPELAVIG